MDERQMIQVTEIAGTILRLGGFAVLGVILGWVHFQTLRRTADLLVRGRGVALAIGLTLGRIALTVAALLWVVTWGALALLSVAAGILIGRGWVMRKKTGGRNVFAT
jgi:hypothetical protein